MHWCFDTISFVKEVRLIRMFTMYLIYVARYRDDVMTWTFFPHYCSSKESIHPTMLHEGIHTPHHAPQRNPYTPPCSTKESIHPTMLHKGIHTPHHAPQSDINAEHQCSFYCKPGQVLKHTVWSSMFWEAITPTWNSLLKYADIMVNIHDIVRYICIPNAWRWGVDPRVDFKH